MKIPFIGAFAAYAIAAFSVLLPSLTHADEQGTTKLRIGTLPAADSVVLYAARDEGLFSEYGLDVEIVPFTSALELGAAMRAGSLDGHFGDIINVLMQNETGAPQAIVATTSRSKKSARYFGLAVGPSSGIEKAEDLKGKTVAIGKATIVEYVFDALASQKGAVDMMAKKDIRQIPIRLQMLMSGQVDAALLPEPLLSLVEARGAKVIWDDSCLTVPLAVLALKKGEMDEPRFNELAHSFRSAVAAAAAVINQEPDKYRQRMIELKLLSPDALPKYSMLTFDLPAIPLGLPTAEEVADYAAWMKKNRALRGDVPAYADVVFVPLLR